MKKSIVCAVLALMLATPAFAGGIFDYSKKDQSSTEIEIKVGRTVNAKPEIDRQRVDVDAVNTIGIEVVAYSNSFIKSTDRELM